MTTIPHWWILEFGRGIQLSSRPEHHQTSARHWLLFLLFLLISMVGQLRLASRMPLANIFCVALPADQQYLKLTANFRLIFKFVSFINEFTRIRKVSCQAVYAFWYRSFYVKITFCILILKTVFGTKNWFCGSQVFLFFCQWLLCWTRFPTSGIYGPAYFVKVSSLLAVSLR